MNECALTVNDFDSICRVCLKFQEDMVDIFRTGVDSQLMKTINVEVRFDDNLPKGICQTCRTQIDYLSEFSKKVKSSDVFLRLLLSGEGNAKEDKKLNTVENPITNKGAVSGKMKPLKTKLKVLSKNSRLNKREKITKDSSGLYVIVVPEVNDNEKVGNEICIKDLSYDSNENLELIHFCKTLVNNHFSNVSNSENLELIGNDNIEKCNENCRKSNKMNFENAKNTYNVNLFIFGCSKCEECFEEIYQLKSHYLSIHNNDISYSEFFYECPICKHKETDKRNFLEHLEKYMKDGYKFVKVNSAGKTMPIKFYERGIFLNLKEFKENNLKIFKVNLNFFNCSFCNLEIEGVDCISSHIKSHYSGSNFKEDFFIKFKCPVCNHLFINNKNNFTSHLNSHRPDNFFFIKVNNNGNPVDLNIEERDIFVSYEDALMLFSLLNKSSNIFEITNENSCDQCNYVAGSLTSLIEHCRLVHSIELPLRYFSLCPICLQDCTTEKIDDIRENFYDHLKSHKNEEIYFIEINKSGSMSVLDEKYSDLFTQSLLLYNFLKYSLPSEFQKIWSPELDMPKSENFSSENHSFTCSKLVKNDEIFHLQLEKNSKDKSFMSYNYENFEKKCWGREDFTRHYNKHNKMSISCSKRPICKVCSKTFASRTSLRNHLSHHTEEVVNETENLFGKICEECGKSFSNSASLAKHKKVHTSRKVEDSFRCEICNRLFFRQSSFNRHKSAHLNPKYFDCDVCKLPLPSITSLQKHSESHKTSSTTYDCRVCSTSFLTKDSLTAHQTHTGHYLGRQPLECNVCGQKFFVGKKFSEHIKTHPKYKMGECGLCGKKLSTFQSLMFHMQRHFQSNSILCPHCGKQFFEEKNYHRHLLTHEGFKPFACDVEGCGKSFYTFFELNRHKKYHNNTRDFVCPYCAKSFHEANHLTVHVRTHTGERPYTCPHCNKGFITRTRCKHHIKLVHQGIGYDLIQSKICKKVAVFETINTVI